MADLLIGMESELTDHTAEILNAWRELVVRKNQKREVTLSFVLDPADIKPVINFEPGPYNSVTI